MTSNNQIIGFLKYYQHPANNKTYFTKIRHRRVPRISFWSGKISTLKSHGHQSESYNKLKNFLLKSLCSFLGKYNLWAFFSKVCYFCKAPCFVVSYLSISGGVFAIAIFVRCHYFQMALKGAIFVGCIWWSLNCNYLLFYQQFAERFV